MKSIMFKIVFLFCFCIQIKAQTEIDIWSGTYALSYQPEGSEILIPMDTIMISPSRTLTEDEVAARFESDLKRWAIRSFMEFDKENYIKARRFLFDEENDEFAEFGWSELHKKDKINCLDAGHFFICQSEQKGEIQIGDESFNSETDIFGIRLHFGLFHLKKLTLLNPKSS